MVIVLFPPGCYGSYLAKCLHHYTTLSGDVQTPFEFDAYGSSHTFRDSGINTIAAVHKLDSQEASNIITISPELDHRLDYFNNQFSKQSLYSLSKYIRDLMGVDVFLGKISEWGIDSDNIETVPKWIVREFFSFYLESCLTVSYPKTQGTVTTSDIVNNIEHTVDKLSSLIGETVLASTDTINKNHGVFLSMQQHYNSQIKCTAWADNVVQGVDSVSPCNTIFDEAYVQHLLRTKGINIKCDGLEDFPTTASALRKIFE